MNLLRELQRARGAHRLQCSDAPDMSGANAAALEQAQLSRDQLEWVKGIYEAEAPARDEARQRANAVSDQQMASSQLQDQVTRESLDHYRTTFKPIEQKLAQQALEYDTPERRAQASGQAMADVGTQADIAREGMVRELASRGVDAGSGNVVAALARGGVAEAAAKAAAGNQASNLVETTGHAYLSDAANLGRNIASSQGTTAGIALNAGNSSVGNSQTALNTGTNGVGMVQGSYSTAINGIGQSANTLTNIGKVQADTAASNSQGLGSLAGAGMMAFAV
jgi:hypothetical protein